MDGSCHPTRYDPLSPHNHNVSPQTTRNTANDNNKTPQGDGTQEQSPDGTHVVVVVLLKRGQLFVWDVVVGAGVCAGGPGWAV